MAEKRLVVYIYCSFKRDVIWSYENTSMKTTLPSSELSISLEKKPGGFALVATISVMVLLVMVALAMLSLSALEVRASRQGDAMAEARANARLALMMAIGELQQYAGADQRITAEAAILEEPDAAEAMANRHWVGVWRSDGLKGEPLTGATPLIHRNEELGADAGSLEDRRADGSYDPKSEALRWLVSRKNHDSPSPDPAVALSENESVLLVGPGSVSNALEEVRAGSVKVSRENEISGRYAWWIGDEGSKARFDLIEPTSGLAKTQPWLSPAQSGIGVIPGYEQYETTEDVSKSLTRSSSDLSGSSSSVAAATEARLKHFHDITFSSVGLLVDSQRGGLRRDLSAFLANGSAPSLGSHTGLEKDTPILDVEKLRDVSPKFGLLHHWHASTASIDRSTGIDPIAPSNIPNGTASRLDMSMYDSTSGSGIDLSSQDKAPIHPVMVDMGVSYGASLVKAGVTVDGQTPYRINVHYFPRVVMWNPYNIKIKAAKYVAQIHLPHKIDFVVSPVSPNTSSRFRYLEAEHYEYKEENLPYHPHFSIPLTSFEPGEALLFTAPAGVAKYWGDPDSALAGDLDHFSLSCVEPAPFNGSFYIKTKQLVWLPKDTVENQQAIYRLESPPNSIASKLYEYKLYLQKASGGGVDSIRSNPSSFPPLQFINQSENGSRHSGAPWYVHIPASVAAPLQLLTAEPAEAFYRFKQGHRVQWMNETVENQNVRAGNYDTPYMGYNIIANHNLRAGWHIRSPVEVGFRATSSAGRYVHGVQIDDPYGWDWQDTSLFPVPVAGKNRVSPFGRPAEFGGQAFPLLDVPTKNTPLVSLGALQHVPLSQFPWHPTNAFGNSLADPRVQRNRSQNFVSASLWDTIGVHNWREWRAIKQSHVNPKLDDASFLYDLSYESNFSLWDNYFLSTVKADYALGDPLDNSRLFVSSDHAEQSAEALKDYHRSARHLVINGAFNVNSTSKIAWASLIASLRSSPEMKITLQDGSSIQANDVYSRFLAPYKTVYVDGDELDEETWIGHRKLTDDQIFELAQEIVKEVKQRGPFISLADFVNRRLVDPPETSGAETPHSTTGLKGALQASIDRTSINSNHLSTLKIPKTEYLSGEWRDYVDQVRYGAEYPEVTLPIKSGNRWYGAKPDHNHWADSKLVGTPSFLTQADMLQKLGPVLSARSDTFCIRAYGESLDANGTVLARVWCEATVQRTQTPISPDAENLDPQADTETHPIARFGRKFIITSFHWLNHSEV
jgi:hypothetical protein